LSDIGNPAGITNTVTRSWTPTGTAATNPDYYIPQCNLLVLTANGNCGTVSSLNFGLPTSATQYNNNTRFGWGTRPYNWEFSTSVQQQLTQGVGLDVGYYLRWYGNFQETQNLAVAPADFSSFSITAPVDPRLPGGGGYVISDLLNVNPAFFGHTTNYTNEASNIGGQYEHDQFVDISINARLKHGILLQGGISTGQTVTDDCAVLAQAPDISPLTIPYCHVVTNWMGQTQIKMLGTYLIPGVKVSVAGTLQSAPGPMVAANYVVPNSLVMQSLGRPLSGGAANVTVNLIPPGTLYGDRENELDMRLSKAVVFGKFRLNLNADVYNTLNSSPVIQFNAAYAAWLVPQRIMDGRLFKLSAQIAF
jgi:hypothetical protein